MTHDPVDDALELLAEPHRRIVCAALVATDATSVEELAASIVTARSDAADDGARRQAVVDLVHVHLPKLADYGVVEYDPRNGDVVPSTGLDRIEPVLDELPAGPNDGWSGGETTSTA